jgi:uncharacterized protein (TIGR03437 family)
MAFARFVLCILIIGACLVGAATAQAQSITIVSGNGMVIPSVHVSPAMSVLVRDAAGNPVKNATVNWTISGGGILSIAQTTTDASGQTTNTFVGPEVQTISPAVSFVQSTITASYATAKVQFLETTAGIVNGILEVQTLLISPTLDQLPLIGAAGQQGTIPAKIQIKATSGPQQGKGVPSVGVSASPDIPTNSSTISCVGGTVLTDSTGTVTCILAFGGKIGSGGFTVNVGNFNFFDLSFKVIAGPPGNFNILNGDQQKGNPGALLPIPLVAEVTDLGGNDIVGVPVVFEAVVPGTVTLSSVSTASDATGRVSAQATLGNIGGNVQVRLRTLDGKVTKLFNLTVNIVIAALQKVSGDPQSSAVVNTQFSSPLIVQVNDPNGKPLQGAPVTFTLTSGNASLGTGSAFTNAQGQASTTVAAGGTPGPIVITASSGGFNVTFNLTSRLAGPGCDPNNMLFNGASFIKNAVSPGAIVTISCTGIAPGVQGSVVAQAFGGLPTQVANVSVKFDGVLAPIYNVSNVNGQESVTVQVPYETPIGSAQVAVTFGTGTTTVNAQIGTAAPGIFETWVPNPASANPSSSLVRIAVLVRPNGTFVSLTNPARPGERMRAYVTGLIPDAGTVSTDMTAPLDHDVQITSPVIVGVNNAGVHVAEVLYARNLIGVWEVQFDVPVDTPSGNLPFAMAIPANGGLVFSQASLIPVGSGQ